jgi:PAS domain S-box-containing protein
MESVKTIFSKGISDPAAGTNKNSGEANFERIIGEVEDYAIILLNTDGVITTWNLGAEKIKGYKADEIIGKNFKVFYPIEDIEQKLPETLLEEARTSGKSIHEGWRVKKDGNRFWGNVVITALHADNGSVTGFIKVTHDLTQRKIAEDKLGNYVEELRFKNAELKKAEEKYHKMVSEVHDYAIILLDPEGKVLDWNKGAEKLKGYKAEEIVGKSFRMFYSNEDREANLPERLLREATTHGFTTHEGYRVRKNGTRFWGNVAISALYDETHTLIGFSKVTKDLSQRKINEDRIHIHTQELQQKNEELKLSEERYHKMISEVRDYAILLLSKEGNVQNWNAGAEVIKGYSAGEIIGKSFKLFYTKDDVDRGLPDKLLAEAELKGRATTEGWRKRKDGSKFWGSILITALHDAKGELIGFSKVTRDLTDKKKAEDDLKKNAIELELKNHELEKLNVELSSFAYVVSHDFKEPIRKIQVFGNRQLEPDKTLEEVKQFSLKIVSSAIRMQNLMEALLSYALISNDQTSDLERIDLNEILESAKSDLEIAIAETSAVINAAELPVIQGISFQMHQLFLNLIGNAIKFAKPGVAPVVSITSKIISDGEVPEELLLKNKVFHKITFSDNGVGFERKQSERIFNVFQRLKAAASDAKGTGIGLAIVKKVVTNHDGFVSAESQPGKGAKFFVYLPQVAD